MSRRNIARCSSPNRYRTMRPPSHPGQMHRHHIGVALDDDRLMALGDVSLAWSRPNSTDDFLYSTVSGVLTYFASFWSSSNNLRAPIR